MFTQADRNFLLAYIIILIAVLTTVNLDTYTLYYFVKPSLIGSLIVYFFKFSKRLPKTLKQLTLGGLFASLAGDITMIFSENNFLFFTLGLGAFLIAHVFYFLAFLKHYNENRNALGFLAACLLYILTIYYFMYDGLEYMFIPVTIYVIVMTAMVTASYMRKGRVSNLSYYTAFFGATLFLISDTFIALNSFYKPITNVNIYVMLIYGIAQYLIILGVLKSTTENKIKNML